MSKPHSITVTVTTMSNGEVNQRTLNEEFATTTEEFMHKDFTITEEVVAAVLKAKHRLAEEYQEVARKFQAGGHRSGEAYAHAQIGRLYESVGNLTKARDEYKQAIDVEETTLGEFMNPRLHHLYQEALNLDQERSGWYAQLASLLIQMKGKEEALAVLELGSQRKYAKMLQEVAVAIRHPKLKQDLQKARSSLRDLRSGRDDRKLKLEIVDSLPNPAVIAGVAKI